MTYFEDRAGPGGSRGLRRGTAADRFAGIARSNLAGGRGCLCLVRFVCCQVEVSATG